MRIPASVSSTTFIDISGKSKRFSTELAKSDRLYSLKSAANSFVTGLNGERYLKEHSWIILEKIDILSELRNEFGNGLVNNLFRLIGENAYGLREKMKERWVSSRFDKELAFKMNSIKNFHKFEMDVNGIRKYWQRETSMKLICEYSKIFEWK